MPSDAPPNIAAEEIMPADPARAADLLLALRLTYLTLVWMTIEGAGALGLGWLSGSLLLMAFGVDSVIELFSAVVLWWRLRAEAGGQRDAAGIAAVEARAAKLAGYALFALAAYVTIASAYGLYLRHASDAQRSVWGTLIGVVAAVGMPLLGRWKLRVAGPGRLNSPALRADAMESLTCGYMSWVLIIGLLATRFLGWWWLDSVAALALVPLLVREGRGAVRGGCCGVECCHG
jgi:divalent metal cation (Fe/Co/Zn/Cd) transporter